MEIVRNLVGVSSMLVHSDRGSDSMDITEIQGSSDLKSYLEVIEVYYRLI